MLSLSLKQNKVDSCKNYSEKLSELKMRGNAPGVYNTHINRSQSLDPKVEMKNQCQFRAVSVVVSEH